jgi:hypothetical protein
MNNIITQTPKRKNRTICIPFDKLEYESCIKNAVKFRTYLDRMIESFPQLFPSDINNGYLMKDSYYCEKISIQIRRIVVGNITYSIRPSFVMPHMTGYTCDVEKVLLLRKFAVPFWVLAYIFGGNSMFWYRMSLSLGRNNLVGTTISDPTKLPQHLCGDEKHCWRNGQKVYIPTTVASNCVLGISVVPSASETDLTKGYGEFKQEATVVKANYCPKTICVDAWDATRNAWKSLFAKISIILCFLHVFISLRDRAQKKFQQPFLDIASKLWDCFRCERRQCFSQSIRKLYESAQKQELPKIIFERLAKLRKRLAYYSIAYAFPACHRTTNMLERVMQRMDRFLFITKYFHGSMNSARLSLRSWALIHNFSPLNPYTVKKKKFRSHAESVNGFRYHDNWLENLLISASLRGDRSSSP